MLRFHNYVYPRYVGLVGAIALAAAAYLGGLGGKYGLSELPLWTRPDGLLCLGAWSAGTALMVIAWWSVAYSRNAPGLGWVITTSVLWAAPLAFAPPLASRDVYLYACQGALYAAGLDPYVVGPAALPCPWLEFVSPRWWDIPSLYGPLFVALAGVAVKVSGGHLWFAVAALRLLAVAGVVLVTAYLPRLARTCGADAARAAWLGLASPLVGTHLIAGSHIDALMIGFAVPGLYYAVRRRPIVGGFWLGIALAVKATAAPVLPFAVLLVANPDRSLRRLVTTAGYVALGCASAYAGVALLTGLGLGNIAGLRRLAGVSYLTSAALPMVLMTLWWWARGRDTPETMRYAAWAMVVSTAVAGLFIPWYWLWPLIVIAAAGLGTLWPIVITVVLAFVVLPDGSNLVASTPLPRTLPLLGVGAAIWWGWRTRRRRVLSQPEKER
jgi:alpha-1,6-mannosyltransferase